MTPEPERNLRLEIGHVLFIDLVGYSKLLIEEQKERLGQLTEIVLATAQVREASDEQLVRLPTGDGMALVFRNSSEEPARCALEIAQALKDHPEIAVRMGIHSGPVSDVTDVSGRTNIAGAGINMAQRVMDCGDAGHILLSQHVADDLAQYRQWAPRLHDLGECEVKHGVRLHVFSLHTEDLGNPERPEKFRQTKETQTAPAMPASEKPARGFRGLVAALILLAVVAVGAGFYFVSHRPPAKAPPASIVPAVPAIPEKSIAVLPFENLSSEKENAYFADGIQDQILTKLASVADLKVISRISTAKYKSKPENLRTVAQELGVATVLEGTVQRAADRVRVNVQLIDARADTHLWAKNYDRELKDVFAVQSEVAQQIADALRAKLSPNEASALAVAPTRDPEAYDFFLQGEYEMRQGESALTSPEPFYRAARFYREALSRDPNFALAVARLAHSRLAVHWYVAPFTAAELEEVKKIVDRALTLAPDLAEAHVSLGLFHYWGRREYDAALAEFQRVLEFQPNNAMARGYLGYVYRRQGEWERSLSALARAAELDPRDPKLPADMAETHLNLRQWSEARRFALRALAIDPQQVAALHALVFGYVNGDGDIEGAKRALASVPGNIRTTDRGAVSRLIGFHAYLRVLERDFAGALQEAEKESAGSTEGVLTASARAAICVLAGDGAGARLAGEEARGPLEAKLHERADDVGAMSQLRWVYLALGRDADALRVAQQTAASLPVEKDAYWGPSFEVGLAEIQARVGEPDEAIKTLRRLLAIPAGASVSLQRLRIDPVWDPIRNDPGFQELLAGKEHVGP